MDFSEQFEILLLLVEGQYSSSLYTFEGKVGEELHFSNIAHSLRRISRSGYLNSGCMFPYLIGNDKSVKIVKEFLNTPAYVGCSVGSVYDTYYFKKFGKTYELIISEDSDDVLVNFVDHDCDDIRKFSEFAQITQCNFEDFAELILQTPRVKSARN